MTAEHKPLDLDKPPFVTTDGREAKLISRDYCREPNQPPHLVWQVRRPDDGRNYLVTSNMEGRAISPFEGLRIINARERVRVRGWVNVYYLGVTGGPVYHYSSCFESREKADEYAPLVRIACIEIDQEVTVGEGL